MYSFGLTKQGPLSISKENDMRVKTLALALALCCSGAASLAQSPQMGTWKLNEAKSKIPDGYMKNTTVVYEMAGDNIKVTTEGTDATGKPMHTEWTGKFDGKDYPLTGDPHRRLALLHASQRAHPVAGE